MENGWIFQFMTNNKNFYSQLEEFQPCYSASLIFLNLFIYNFPIFGRLNKFNLESEAYNDDNVW